MATLILKATVVLSKLMGSKWPKIIQSSSLTAAKRKVVIHLVESEKRKSLEILTKYLESL